MPARRLVVNTKDVVNIIVRTLEKKYNVDKNKFDAGNLITVKGKVRGDLLQKLENKINHQLDETERRKVNLKSVFLDFGPYPVNKSWQIKNNRR